jgi:hypothetical protein
MVFCMAGWLAYWPIAYLSSSQGTSLGNSSRKWQVLMAACSDVHDITNLLAMGQSHRVVGANGAALRQYRLLRWQAILSKATADMYSQARHSWSHMFRNGQQSVIIRRVTVEVMLYQSPSLLLY